MLTSVPLTLVDETDSLPPALVAGLLPDGSLEEALAALAADGSVVTTWPGVNIKHCLSQCEAFQSREIYKDHPPTTPII